MMGKLVRCIKCNEVMNMTEWDSYPEYIWNSGEIKEIEMNDREAFLHRHKGHEMEELTPVTPPISDKPYIEPMKTCYFEASNGNKRFLVQMWRNKIDNPFAYKIIKGRIEIKNEKVQVQTEAIKRQIRMEKGFCISEEKVDKFIKAIQKEAERLNPETLEVSAEGDTPLVSYCRLDDDCVRRILTRCQDEFDQQKLKLLRDFILRNNEYYDVMTLVVEKRFSIRQERRSRPHHEKTPQANRARYSTF
ncbi:MAG: hypothetical protein JRI46_11230 [Deltaproteobacteria bacterium]|nr:hypothetical protein [Deltaproteobacteria bacterium]